MIPNTSDDKDLLDEPLLLARALGHPDLKSVNGQWMKMILNGKKDMTLQAHRNSYKSTCLSVCAALM